MSEKFRNKYKIKSARLAGYDYSQNGMYFVTICTKDREEFFGEIKNDKIKLSEIGEIADRYWREISAHFPFIVVDVYQIMPNHVHGIIEIRQNQNMQTQHYNVETQNFAFLQKEELYKNKFGPQSKNLSSVIRGFKAGVKKYATKNDIQFAWQARFYDHIIRNDESLNKIREYIEINPKIWQRDRNNVENIFM